MSNCLEQMTHHLRGVLRLATYIEPREQPHERLLGRPYAISE